MNIYDLFSSSCILKKYYEDYPYKSKDDEIDVKLFC